MAYRDVILADSPVNYWRLGESSGNAIDEMGEHDLTWAGTPVYGATGALVNDANTAMTLDGATEYANKAVGGYRSGDSQGAIELWCKDMSSSGYAVSSADTASTSRYISLILTPTAVQFTQRNNDTYDAVYNPAVPLNDGSWHYVVVTSDSNSYKIYVDGEPVALTVTSGTNSGDWFADTLARDNLTIGDLIRTSSTGKVAGSLDEVAVYNYPLTAAQILRHYNSGLDQLNSVLGTITDDTGTPCARTIGLLRRDNFDLLGTATSDASTGAYAISDLDYDGECIRIVLDDSDGTLYNDLIDRIIPG
jgi:hypothetical protein